MGWYMVKIEVKTETTCIIDLPIDSFFDITEAKMSTKDSDEMIMNYLSDHLEVGVDKIISVKPL